MVPVGDVCDRNPGKKLHKFVRRAGGRGCDFPHRVADAVRRHEIVERSLRTGVGDDEVDRLVVTVGEERRTRVGRQRLDVTRAVVFLVLARLLVLLQNTGEIVLRVKGRDDSGLRMGTHRLTIGVELRLSIANQSPIGDQSV